MRDAQMGWRARARWIRRMGRLAGDNRGLAILTALFVTFGVGMMLFGFAFMNIAEVQVASVNRNGTQALDLAEAGIQEGLKRLTMSTVVPGRTQFANSLAGTSFAPGSTGSVNYQATIQGLSTYFPVLSTATSNGAKRAVRVIEQAVYTVTPGNVIYGPSAGYTGNASPMTGDEYSVGSISFQQYKKSPLCASGATQTNLISPQVMSGTTIGSGNGPAQSPPCGSPSSTATGPYSAECADGSLTEVAPTSCSADGGSAVVGGQPLPWNWHPMTPVGMAGSDFNTVVAAVQAGTAPAGIAWVTATQGGAAVTYAPYAFTPPYWTSVPATNGEVILITATQPFCVNSSLGTVTLPSPAITGSCSGGFVYYGNQSGGTPQPTRFVDWGIVSDDLNRGIGVAATKFFQPSLGCPTCGGNPNGIRYVPLLPTVNVMQYACAANVLSPGTNVFDNVTGGPTVCSNPPTTTINSTNVTFSGTKDAPESLVIDNSGAGQVKIFGSAGGPGSCGGDFTTANWGTILATGDIDLQANMTFSGFVYSLGSITSHGTVVMQGGIFAANATGPNPPTNGVSAFGNDNYCAGNIATLPISPIFFSFRTVSWQEVPLNRLP